MRKSDYTRSEFMNAPNIKYDKSYPERHCHNGMYHTKTFV